jgi:hypothetical protein
VNILHDIDICFIAIVHMNYLVFLRRLKHDGLVGQIVPVRAKAPPLFLAPSV